MKQLYLTVCAYVDLWLTMDISTFFFFIKKINCKHLRMDFLEGRELDELFCLNRQRRKSTFPCSKNQTGHNIITIVRIFSVPLFDV